MHRSKGVLIPTLAFVRTSGPLSVIATVCSKWAESESSSVEIDQRSSAIQTSGPPALIIGSIASVMPGWSSGPLPGLAEVRHLRLLVHRAPDPVADERADDREAGGLGRALDGGRDVLDVVAGPGLLDAGRERRLADLEQPLGLVVDLAHGEGVGGVRHEAVEGHADVDRDDVAVLERVRPGMPWTTIEFGDVQIAAGKPR